MLLPTQTVTEPAPRIVVETVPRSELWSLEMEHSEPGSLVTVWVGDGSEDD